MNKKELLKKIKEENIKAWGTGRSFQTELKMVLFALELYEKGLRSDDIPFERLIGKEVKCTDHTK